MRRTLEPRGLAIALALAIAALPASAGAKKYQMSGAWFIRNGRVFVPLQFAFSGTMTRHSMGTGTLFGGPASQPFNFHFPMSLPVGPMTDPGRSVMGGSTSDGSTGSQLSGGAATRATVR
jgi:hypothetical protein